MKRTAGRSLIAGVARSACIDFCFPLESDTCSPNMVV